MQTYINFIATATAANSSLKHQNRVDEKTKSEFNNMIFTLQATAHSY